MTIFAKIINDAIAKGIDTKSQQAREWYRSRALGTSASASGLLKSVGIQNTKQISFGSMVLFHYEPKHADKLPFYDRFPLIFPVDAAVGGFYGLNLHYLPHPLRASLMDNLYKFATDTNYDANTRMYLSYSMLKQSSRLRYFRPCFKHYLNTHVRSSFRVIDPSEWDIALFLPLERFAKGSRSDVHATSIHGY